MSKSGTLYIKIRSDVGHIQSGALVEVRDSSLRLVELAGNFSQIDLPLGLYEVSAVLEDGNKYRQYARIEEGITSTVTLQVEREGLDTAVAERSLPKNISAELLEVYGAEMISKTSSGWQFQAQPNTRRVPTALIRVDDHRFLISLPVSSTHADNGTCTVRVEQQGKSLVVSAWLSPDQRIANAMQNMLASGFFLEAAGVAGDAIALLAGKYRDPVGAALGALIMLKTGQLKQKKSWVENLARDFSWLPDGKVMLVSLLFDEESERERALDLAIAASRQQILFTENYSLLLALLRRWPRGSDTEKIENAIEIMASRSPFVDWESICLSYMIPEEE